jgi:putative membrane protein
MFDRERRERMHGWIHGPGRFPAREFTDWMWIGFAQALVWLLVVAAAILLVAWLLRRLSRERAPVTTNRARAILDERYARGELTRDEYLAMRRDLEGNP